ncbi:phosphomannomutase [Aureimonas endophytica]|uniref:Phosphomannomutase n=1 Tax=Aureimonas endophytica TaxID=2027858 RepID=A0A916ZK21_9HYPH|nr:phosphomannomutase [Aureimonas endophytica]GGE00150.1 phosphomannomutase [Aureimonas endophytica]
MSSLKFGTSGLRGLVTDLVGWPSYAYSLAFLRHVGTPGRVFIGRDLRGSSPEIAQNCIAAARAAGFRPVDCGALPTPALALAALSAASPAIMITGSHIPDDRNGLKFYSAEGEITKADEAGILARFAEVEAEGRPAAIASTEAERLEAISPYHRRYLDFFGPAALDGLRIGVYQHSSVARDVLADLVAALGAVPVALGRSDSFIPVDTEAHRAEDIAAVAGWAAEGTLDAIVSTDGDADRPLVADERGRILRGDVIGLVTARHLGLSTIVTPVTSSAAVEASGIAAKVRRTKVGSPFVIAGMVEAAQAGETGIVGFEANGGLLLFSDVARGGRHLPALATRDAMLPILSTLAEAKAKGQSLGAVVDGLDAGHAAAHRLQEVPAERSGPFLARLASDAAYREAFFAPVGIVREVNALDGVRVLLADGATVHFRASGNAPELRCYVEAGSEAKARELLEWGLATAEATVR